MVFVTITALIYIHMQMQIVDLAYKGKSKERRVHELRDDNGMITHQILTLKSANHLGENVLGKDATLQFMGHDKVLTVTRPQVPASGAVSRPSTNENTPSKLMSNILSLLSPQEAKAWE